MMLMQSIINKLYVAS